MLYISGMINEYVTNRMEYLLLTLGLTVGSYLVMPRILLKSTSVGDYSSSDVLSHKISGG